MSFSSNKRIRACAEKSRIILRVVLHPGSNVLEVVNRFYLIDLNNHPPATKYAVELQPFSETPPNLSLAECGCVITDSSIIYLFGDCSVEDEEASQEVYYYDIRSPESGWRIGPSMMAARSRPHCQVAPNDFIYVFPGEYDYNYVVKKSPKSPIIWGEVLDPFVNQWTALPSPEPGVSRGRDMLIYFSDSAVYDHGHILLSCPLDRKLYLYDLQSKSWKVLECKFFDLGLGGYGIPFTVVDDILYVFHRKLWAYDLKNPKSDHGCCVAGLNFVDISPPLHGLNFVDISPPLHDTNGYGSPDPNYPTTFVHHLGNGKLCLVWTEERNGRILHCTKFRVCKHSDGGDETAFHAIVLSFAVYTICNSITESFAIS